VQSRSVRRGRSPGVGGRAAWCGLAASAWPGRRAEVLPAVALALVLKVAGEGQILIVASMVSRRAGRPFSHLRPAPIGSGF